MPTENNGSSFGSSTFAVTFPVVGSSGVSHPHETLQSGNELFVPDLVSPKRPVDEIRNAYLFLFLFLGR